MNQRLISSFADFAPDPVMVFATDGRLESVNTHAANLLGIPRTAVGTLTLVDLLGGQSKAARAVIRQALAQKEPTPIRLTVAAPGREAAELSGECWRIGGIGRAWVGVRFNQTGSAAGIFGELAVTIDELNRQLRAKDRVLKRLAELEAEARRIQAEAKIGSWQWQRGDAKVALSDEAGRLLGLAPGQSSVDIRTYLKRTEQADRRRVAQALQALYRDGGPVEIEHKLRVNEEHRDLRIRGRADERDTSRIFGFVQDMTRRKQFDRMLRHSESRLSSILEAASDAIIVFDETGEILLFNQAAERLYRWTARQAIGDSIFRLIPEELHGSGNIEDLLKVVRRRAGKNLYQRGRRISGEEFPAEVRWSNSEFEGKKYFAVTVRDVSSKKALEEKLRDAQRLDAIGQLTGGVAHDFNNLLTVILGNAEACRAEMALNRQAREHLDLILLAGQKGADLT
ncbi:MAG: PAS domain S-box protein, partial [Rhodospirillaceae bacterium]|nr:PAS domain S-box protein [Rhodospirillaceae bacterium]